MAGGPQLNSMPTARYNLGAGVFDLGNVVYAVGGRTLSGSPTRDGMATTALEAYNVAKGSWAQLTGMPTARAELGVAVVDVLLYAIGGSVGSAETTSALECFNPATGKWHTLESMPTSRATFATGVIGVSIYVAGGIYMSSDGKPWPPLPLSTMETYNTETGKWTTLNAMPTARFWVAGSVVNNLFYATGGTASNGAGWAVGVSGVQSQTDFFSARHQTTSGMGACNGCWSESFSPSTGWEKLEDIPISEIGGQNIWWNCIEVISATMYGMILGTNNVTFVEYSCTSNWGGLDCSDCDAIHFGTTCSEPVTCSTAHGICSPPTCSGTAGTGHCSSCASGWGLASGCTTCDTSHYGAACASAVTCNVNHGTCAPTTCSSTKGNGHCSTCSPGWTLASDCTDCDVNHFGSTCTAITCDISHGTCEPATCSGTKGNGACSTCVAGFRGPTCGTAITCNTTHGTCSVGPCSGPSGTGNCSACDATHFGLDCTNNVTCSAAHGICAPANCSGINNKGLCSSCDAPHFGLDCTNNVTCSTTHGVCSLTNCSGVRNTGHCSSCDAAHFGLDCTTNVTCSAAHGICATANCSGVGNKGHYSSCDITHFGVDCTNNVTCSTTNGVCSSADCSGIDNKGHCSSCKPNWDIKAGIGDCTNCTIAFFGPTCSNPVTCVHGTNASGIDKDGKCVPGSCSNTTKTGFWTGKNCDNCTAQYFGPSCTQNITCKRGHPSNGTTGNGACIGACFANSTGTNCDGCDADHFGPSCRQKVSCATAHGTCAKGNCSGTSGNGHCSTCDANHAGEDCTTAVTCVHGKPNQGTKGDGHCIPNTCATNWDQADCNNCTFGWFGSHCSSQVTCMYGLPSFGVDGDGRCISCNRTNSGKGKWNGPDCSLCNGKSDNETGGSFCEDEIVKCRRLGLSPNCNCNRGESKQLCRVLCGSCGSCIDHNVNFPVDSNKKRRFLKDFFTTFKGFCELTAGSLTISGLARALYFPQRIEENGSPMAPPSQSCSCTRACVWGAVQSHKFWFLSSFGLCSLYIVMINYLKDCIDLENDWIEIVGGAIVVVLMLTVLIPRYLIFPLIQYVRKRNRKQDASSQAPQGPQVTPLYEGDDEKVEDIDA